jgi:hypothetical protein
VVACVLSFAACGGGGTLTGAGGAGTGGGLVGSGGVGATGVVTGIGGTTGGAGGLSGGGGATMGGTGGDGWYCGADTPTRELRPRVIVVLDASQSMNDDMNAVACSGGCGQGSKWAAAVDAINTVAVESEPRAMWGLELFGIEGTDVCGTRTNVSVEPLPGAAPAVARALQDQSTANGGVAGGMTRQTRGAVDAAMTYAMLQTDGNDKVIVLMTDGVPTCASGGAPAADDTRATVDVITWARNGGYRTFVVGIATAGGPGHDSLNMMGTAAGGVGFDGDGGGASYFAASSAAELRSALRAVVDTTGGCTFELPPPPNMYVSRSNIVIKLGDVYVPKDNSHVAGWDYLDASMRAVRLYGAPCDTARSKPAPPVAIVFVCLAV